MEPAKGLGVEANGAGWRLAYHAQARITQAGSGRATLRAHRGARCVMARAVVAAAGRNGFEPGGAFANGGEQRAIARRLAGVRRHAIRASEDRVVRRKVEATGGENCRPKDFYVTKDVQGLCFPQERHSGRMTKAI